MPKKFVEPIDCEMYAWCAPDGSIQTPTMALDIPTMLGFTKLMSQKNISQTSEQLLKRGFSIHKVKVVITEVERVQMTPGIMAALML